MKQSLITCILAVILLLSSGCTTSPTNPEDSFSQQETITRWQRCINTNIDANDEGTNPVNSILERTVSICQGHKRDVLATFPRKYEHQLADLMEERAYETGINRIAIRRNGLDSVSAGFRKLIDGTNSLH